MQAAPKAQTAKVTEEKSKEVKDDKTTKLDNYYTAKSEKVIALLYANHTLEEKKVEMEKTTTDCEKFNNQD